MADHNSVFQIIFGFILTTFEWLTFFFFLGGGGLGHCQTCAWVLNQTRFQVKLVQISDTLGLKKLWLGRFRKTKNFIKRNDICLLLTSKQTNKRSKKIEGWQCGRGYGEAGQTPFFHVTRVKFHRVCVRVCECVWVWLLVSLAPGN